MIQHQELDFGPDKGRRTIHYKSLDLGARQHLSIAMEFYEAGRDEGMIPPDRAELTGSEEAVFAIAGQAAIGCAVFYQPVDQNLMWLDILFVSPKFRRFGIGSTLFDNVRRIAADRGLPDMEFGTLTHNAPMLALGRKLGFSNGTVYLKQPIPQDRNMTARTKAGEWPH